jgi:hypothetical protein
MKFTPIVIAAAVSLGATAAWAGDPDTHAEKRLEEVQREHVKDEQKAQEKATKAIHEAEREELKDAQKAARKGLEDTPIDKDEVKEIQEDRREALKERQEIQEERMKDEHEAERELLKTEQKVD